MKQTVSKATLGRLPEYLRYLKSLDCENVSSGKLAIALGYGEVQVRKDLASISGTGKPRTGYNRVVLINDAERVLCGITVTTAVIAGAGKLGLAILGYGGFGDFGIEITAAFDTDCEKVNKNFTDKPVYPIENLRNYCMTNGVETGIITVPSNAAQGVADEMVKAGITAIWNFAPCNLTVPANVLVKNENLALSLAHLTKSVK